MSLAGHLPSPPDVLLISPFELDRPATWRKNLTVTVSYTAVSCAAHKENDYISEIRNGITEQIIIDVSGFYSANELCVLSNLAQCVLCNYCILQCFCNRSLNLGMCVWCVWGAVHLHSLLMVHLFIVNNTFDVLASRLS